ncbi:right-handed parallel beta-helix repeat-containing protein [Candidatus Chloroploca sp. M-50]|uniref:Right-handed parallel beta-helix repeat-containing protein n=1 Tax=Candidatus Chloroploca mongolica TaxID=2528176 RepID=A0ABS4D9F3_9CHLR|nr:right-handed parallel beta-helix repeat-containing protein [Candidatus Chloroploca mongolica]
MASLNRRLALVLVLSLLFTLLAPLPVPWSIVAAQASIVVSNLNDLDNGGANDCGSDGCSLREAIRLANSRNGPNSITFTVTGTLTLESALPILTDDETTLDATSADPAATQPNVTLNALGIAPGSHGLHLQSNNNVVRGLAIIRAPAGMSADVAGAGIFLDGASGNQLYQNWLGLAADGTAQGNQGYGLLIGNGASNNIIGADRDDQRNVLTSNVMGGIRINTASNTALNQNNLIEGNYIGTTPAGDAAGNNGTRTDSAGISLGAGAVKTTIRNNVIGGFPQSFGIFMPGLGQVSTNPLIARDNVIVGNAIGVTRGGIPVPNKFGLQLGSNAYGPRNTTIGGLDLLDRNIIAGNTSYGIRFLDTGFVWGDATILGNLIGLTADGTPLPNGTTSDSSSGAIFIGRLGGGTAQFPPGRVTVGAKNVIAASRSFGVHVRSSNHVIKGNYIGTSLSGDRSQTGQTAFGGASVFLEHGTGVTIGGTTTADRNVIAYGGSQIGGARAAILINPVALGTNRCNGTCTTSGHVIEGNYLGVRPDGVTPLNAASPSGTEGMRIWRTTGVTVRNNLIGGVGQGLALGEPSEAAGAVTNLLIEGNLIGAPATGELPLDANLAAAPRNFSVGIRLYNGSNNVIRQNLVAYNGSGQTFDVVPGILIGSLFDGNLASNNDLLGNRLVRNGGVDAPGIQIRGATGIRISQTTTEFHQGPGIALLDGGNAGRTPPTLNPQLQQNPEPEPPSVTGSTDPACGPGCTVEIFTTSRGTEADEGPIYLASGLTLADGTFNIPLPVCQRYLNATVTDATGNTSPFSTRIDLGVDNPCAPIAFDLVADPAGTERAVAPGEQTTYLHTLNNTSPITLTFSVALTSTQRWANGPTLVTVPPNASTEIPVTVTVPATQAEAATETTSVRALVGTARSSNVVVNTTTVRLPGPAFPALTGPLTTTLAGPTTIFTHTVSNVGDVVGDFTVASTGFVGDAPPGWSVASVTPASFTLTPTQTMTVTVLVNTPGTPPAGPLVFGLRALVTGDETRVAQTANTIIVPVVRGFAFTPVTLQRATTDPGATVRFSYVLTNTGNAADSFAVATSVPPVGLTLTGVTATPSLSNLAAGITSTVQVSYAVADDALAGTYPLTVTARATGGVDPPAPALRSLEVVVRGSGAVTLTPPLAEPPAVDLAGATQPVAVTAVFTATNSGNASAPILPGPVTGLPSGWTGNVTGNACPVGLPGLAPAASCLFTVTVTVPPTADAGVNDLTVAATADNSAQTNPAVPDVTDEATLRVQVAVVRGVALRPANLAQAALPGDTVTFAHTLENTGNAPDSYTLTVSQSAILPAWTLSLTPTAVSDLARDGTRTITTTTVVPANLLAGDVQQLTVRAAGVNDGPTAEVTAVVTIGSLVAGELLDSPRGSVDPGETTTYTVTVRNTGTERTRYTLVLSDTLSGWRSAVGPATPALLPGMTGTLVISVTAPADAPPDATNTTRLRLVEDGAPTLILDEREATTRIGPVVRGFLFTPATLQRVTTDPGTTVRFSYRLTNTGNVADSFTIVPAVPPAGFSVAGVSATPSLNDLPVGASSTVHVSYTVGVGVLEGTYPLTITARVNGGDDPPPDALRAAEIVVRGRGAVALAPEVAEPPAVDLAGATQPVALTVVFTATNTGNAPAPILPGPVTGLPVGWTGEVTDNACPAALPGLAPAATCRFTVTVSIPVDADGGVTDLTVAATADNSARTNPLVPDVTDQATLRVRVAIERGVALRPDGLAQLAGPGQTATFVHTLENTGNAPDSFNLSVLQPQAEPVWAVEVRPEVVSDLARDGTRTITTTAVVPATALPGESVRLTIRASGVNAGPVAEVTALVTVTEQVVRDFVFTPEPLQRRTTVPGTTVRFTYVLTNTGNGLDSFALDSSVPPDGVALLDVTATPSLVNLAAGVSSEVQIRYAVDSAALAGTYPLTITARSVGGLEPPAPAVRSIELGVVAGGSVVLSPDLVAPPEVDLAGATQPVAVTALFTATNTGNASAPILPGPVTGLPSGWTGDVTGNGCPSGLPGLAPAASCQFTVTVTVPPAADAGVTDLIVAATADNSAQTNPTVPDVTDEATLRLQVAVVRGVALRPDDLAQQALPGETVTFVHTLENTGNVPDSYTLSVSQTATLPAWTVNLTPTEVSDLPRAGTQTLTTTTVVPANLLAGEEQRLTVRTVGVNEGPVAEVTALVTIGSLVAGELLDSPRGNVNVGGTSTTYAITVRNTGTERTSYTLVLSDTLPGWRSEVGAATPALLPGMTGTVTINVTAPSEAVRGDTNTTVLRLVEEGVPAVILDEGEAVTRVGPLFSLILTPDRALAGAPGTLVESRHTLTNLGSTEGTFRLRVADSLGWFTNVTPDLVTLGPDEEIEILALVRIPEGVRADTPNVAIVTAQQLDTPVLVEAQARIDLRVTLVAGLKLASSQVRRVQPGQGLISMSDLAVTNLGSGSDTITLTVVGESDGWEVDLSRSSVWVDHTSTARVSMRVVVPERIAPGTIKTLRIEGRSTNDETVTDAIELSLIYFTGGQTPSRVFLPLVRR